MENALANCGENVHLAILHLLRVELRCKLQEKLHDITQPLHYLPSQGKMIEETSLWPEIHEKELENIVKEIRTLTLGD